MKMRKWAPSCWMLTLALLAGASTVSCHRAGPETQLTSLEDHIASRLLGKQIESEDGEKLATLDDLFLDLRPGKATFGLLASDGFLGLGKRLKIVPCQALSTRTTKKDVLALDITKPGWEHAPVLKSTAALALSDPVVAKNIERYYQIAASQNNTTLPASAAPPEPSVPTPTGHQQGPDSAHHLKSVRELTGDVVVNRQHQRIGRIVDFLVDLSGRRTSYAIISTERLLRGRERFAVPLILLNQVEVGVFVIDANRSMFEQAQRFDAASWENNRMELGKILRFSKDAAGQTSQPGSILTAL